MGRAPAKAPQAALEAPKRLQPAQYTPEVRAKLREVKAISGRLAKAGVDTKRRVELVAELVEVGVPITAVARYAGVSPAALHKSKRRAGKNDAGGL